MIRILSLLSFLFLRINATPDLEADVNSTVIALIAVIDNMTNASSNQVAQTIYNSQFSKDSPVLLNETLTFSETLELLVIFRKYVSEAMHLYAYQDVADALTNNNKMYYTWDEPKGQWYNESSGQGLMSEDQALDYNADHLLYESEKTFHQIIFPQSTQTISKRGWGIFSGIASKFRPIKTPNLPPGNTPPTSALDNGQDQQHFFDAVENAEDLPTIPETPPHISTNGHQYDYDGPLPASSHTLPPKGKFKKPEFFNHQVEFKLGRVKIGGNEWKVKWGYLFNPRGVFNPIIRGARWIGRTIVGGFKIVSRAVQTIFWIMNQPLFKKFGFPIMRHYIKLRLKAIFSFSQKARKEAAAELAFVHQWRDAIYDFAERAS